LVFFRFGHVHFESEEAAANFRNAHKSEIQCFTNSTIQFSKSTDYKKKEKVIDNMVSFLFLSINIVLFLNFLF
jgi:catabolite regulation protein CreA